MRIFSNFLPANRQSPVIAPIEFIFLGKCRTFAAIFFICTPLIAVCPDGSNPRSFTFFRGGRKRGPSRALVLHQRDFPPIVTPNPIYKPNPIYNPEFTSAQPLPSIPAPISDPSENPNHPGAQGLSSPPERGPNRPPPKGLSRGGRARKGPTAPPTRLRSDWRLGLDSWVGHEGGTPPPRVSPPRGGGAWDRSAQATATAATEAAQEQQRYITAELRAHTLGLEAQLQVRVGPLPPKHDPPIGGGAPLREGGGAVRGLFPSRLLLPANPLF